eukprot:214223-Pyramimonas_sp.AAC.1
MHASLFSHAQVTARARKERPSMNNSRRSSMGRLAGAITVGCQSEAGLSRSDCVGGRRGEGVRGRG